MANEVTRQIESPLTYEQEKQTDRKDDCIRACKYEMNPGKRFKVYEFVENTINQKVISTKLVFKT